MFLDISQYELNNPALALFACFIYLHILGNVLLLLLNFQLSCSSDSLAKKTQGHGGGDTSKSYSSVTFNMLQV